MTALILATVKELGVRINGVPAFSWDFPLKHFWVAFNP